MIGYDTAYLGRLLDFGLLDSAAKVALKPARIRMRLLFLPLQVSEQQEREGHGMLCQNDKKLLFQHFCGVQSVEIRHAAS